MEEQLNTKEDSKKYTEQEKEDMFFKAINFEYWYGVKKEEKEQEECCSLFHELEIINPKELFNHNN